jgi:hypothetical protein
MKHFLLTKNQNNVLIHMKTLKCQYILLISVNPAMFCDKQLSPYCFHNSLWATIFSLYHPLLHRSRVVQSCSPCKNVYEVARECTHVDKPFQGFSCLLFGHKSPSSCQQTNTCTSIVGFISKITTPYQIMISCLLL